jgi:hypothetical protein
VFVARRPHSRIAHPAFHRDQRPGAVGYRHFRESAITGQFGKIKVMPGKKGPGISPQIQSRGMPHIHRVREALQEMMDEHAYDRPSNRISTNTVYAKRSLRQRLRSRRLFGK